MKNNSHNIQEQQIQAHVLSITLYGGIDLVARISREELDYNSPTQPHLSYNQPRSDKWLAEQHLAPRGAKYWHSNTCMF